MFVGEKARPLTAFVLIALTAACGGTVVFEEDGGQGLAGQGGDGDGGSQSTSSDGGSSASNNPTSSNVTTNVASGNPTTTVGPTSVSVGPGPSSNSVGPGPGPISASSGIAGCGTLLDDLGSLGEGPQCDNCAEAACCGELIDCSAGTPCWNCIFGGDCTDQGSQRLDALVNCVFGPTCGQSCNGGGCDDDEFQCFKTGECLPFQLVCDGDFDCEDGSDESPDICGPCGPDAFFCNDGFCIADFQVCDGFFDCSDGEDEFCFEGICDSGLDTGNEDLNQCLGQVCCFEFELCTDFGGDVDGCLECLQNGGGPQCNEALECAQFSGCFEGGGDDDICDSGLATDDPQTNECLTNNCCDGLFFCLEFGQDACLDCLSDPEGGEICDEFIGCACGACDFCF
jgi:hypothetical protein